MDHKQLDSDKLLARLDKMGPAINEYAKAKSERVYIEQYRKSLKAILMINAKNIGKEKGYKTIADFESYAYSHEDYVKLISGLQYAVETEEKHKWALEKLKMELEVWRSLNANDRHVKNNV